MAGRVNEAEDGWESIYAVLVSAVEREDVREGSSGSGRGDMKGKEGEGVETGSGERKRRRGSWMGSWRSAKGRLLGRTPSLGGLGWTVSMEGSSKGSGLVFAGAELSKRWVSTGVKGEAEAELELEETSWDGGELYAQGREEDDVRRERRTWRAGWIHRERTAAGGR